MRDPEKIHEAHPEANQSPLSHPAGGTRRADGRIDLIVAGSTVAAAATPSRILRPASAGGARVWVARDAGAHNAYDQVAGMVTSPDGSTVYVARTSAGKVAVVAHDTLTGVSRWSASTSDPGGQQIFAEAVSISPDGTRLFVTGDVEQSANTRAARTIAYDTADGSVVWTANVDVPAYREIIPRSIIVSPDGTRVFVTGARTGTHGSGDFWDYDTVAYSAVTGTRLWKAIFGGPAHGGDTPEALGVSPDGSKVFVTGTSKDGGASDRDFVTIAYRAGDGSPQWTSRYSAGADNFAVGLVVSPNGSTVYVARYGRAAINLPHDYQLVAYRSGTGAQAGTAQYAGGDDDFSSSVAINGDGTRVFLTRTGGQDFLTVAFDASTLVPLWSSRYDGQHGFDTTYAVTVSPDGGPRLRHRREPERRIACFGDVSSTAYATVSYAAASGGQRWVSRYHGLRRDPDQAERNAVSPDGSSVFVSGNSDYGCRGSDVATLDYPP